MMMLGHGLLGSDLGWSDTDDGVVPSAQPMRPRRLDDELDEDALIRAGVLIGRDHRVLNVGIVCEVIALLRSHPAMLQAMGSPLSTQHPAIAAMLGEIDLLAQTRASLAAPPPPLSRGGIRTVLDTPAGDRVDRSVVVQVESAGAATNQDGIFRVRLVLSDGEFKMRALLDSRLHGSLCGDLIEFAASAEGDSDSDADESDDGLGDGQPPPVVGSVWSMSSWTRYRADTGADVIVVHNAAAILGYPAGTEVVGVGDLDWAVEDARPPPSPVTPTYTVTDGAGVPDQPGHIPTVRCNGCDCGRAWGKVGTAFDHSLEYPSTFACVGCRAAHIPPAEEVWDEMVERFPDNGPYEADPHDAPAEQRRFARYYCVATNWFDARGSGIRVMLPRCIWAAIRAADPSDTYDELIPEPADYMPEPAD